MKKLKIGKSNIHGKGLFSGEPIKKGELIAKVHNGIQIDPENVKYMPTQYGRFYNHDEKGFNTRNEVIGNHRYLRALKNIPANTELTANYMDNPEMEQPEDFGSGKYASFDFDKTIATDDGLAKARQMIRDGYNLFIVSARDKVTPDMVARARKAGIPEENIIATGSDEAKVRKVKQLGVEKHFDDKPEVIAALGAVGEQFKKGGGVNTKRYTKSLTGTNKLFTKNKLFKKKSTKRIYDPNAKYFDNGGMVSTESDVECTDDGRCYETDQIQEMLDRGRDIPKEVLNNAWSVVDKVHPEVGPGISAATAWKNLGVPTLASRLGMQDPSNCMWAAGSGWMCEPEFKDVPKTAFESNDKFINAVNKGTIPFTRVTKTTDPYFDFKSKGLLQPGDILNLKGPNTSHAMTFSHYREDGMPIYVDSNGKATDFDWDEGIWPGMKPGNGRVAYISRFSPEMLFGEKIKELEEKARTNPTYYTTDDQTMVPTGYRTGGFPTDISIPSLNQYAPGGAAEQKIIFSPKEGSCPDGEYWTGTECKKIPANTKIVYSQEELDKLNASKKQQQKLYNEYLARENNSRTINRALKDKYGNISQHKLHFYPSLESLPYNSLKPYISYGKSSLIPNGLGSGIPSMNESMVDVTQWKKMIKESSVKPIGYKGHPGGGHFYPIYDKPSDYLLGYNREDKQPIDDFGYMAGTLAEQRMLEELQPLRPDLIKQDLGLPVLPEEPEILPPDYYPVNARFYNTKSPDWRIKYMYNPFTGKGPNNTQESGGIPYPTIYNWYTKSHMFPGDKRAQNRTNYNEDYYFGAYDDNDNYIKGELEKAEEEKRRINFSGARSRKDKKAQKEYNKSYDEYEELMKQKELERKFVESQIGMYKYLSNKKEGGYVEELPEMEPGGQKKCPDGQVWDPQSKSCRTTFKGYYDMLADAYKGSSLEKKVQTATKKVKDLGSEIAKTPVGQEAIKNYNQAKEDAAYEKFLDQNLGKEGSNTYTYVDPITNKTEQREYSNAHLKDKGNISVDEATWNANRDRQNMQHLSEALSGVGEITGINSAIRTGERLIDDPLKFADDLTTGISQAPETLVEGAMTLGSKLFGDNKDYVDVDTDALGVALDVAGALPVVGTAGKLAKPLLNTGLKYGDDALNFIKGYRASAANKPNIQFQGSQIISNPNSKTSIIESLDQFPENIRPSKEQVHQVIDDNINYIKSPEYKKLRMQNTGETEAEVDKAINSYIKSFNETKLTSKTDAANSGQYTRGNFLFKPEIGIDPRISSSDEFLNILDHEIKHGFSPFSQSGKANAYKNYPVLEGTPTAKDPSLKEFFIGMDPNKKAMMADINYHNLPHEQQVRALRLKNQIKKDLGVSAETPLKESDIQNWMSKHPYRLPESLNDVEDLFRINTSTPTTKNVANWLNNAWMTIPATGIAGATIYGTSKNSTEPQNYKEGGSIGYQLGDEVDEATMKQLMKLGYTFEKI